MSLAALKKQNSLDSLLEKSSLQKNKPQEKRRVTLMSDLETYDG